MEIDLYNKVIGIYRNLVFFCCIGRVERVGVCRCVCVCVGVGKGNSGIKEEKNILVMRGGFINLSLKIYFVFL